jgi:hypothetical protein
MKKLFLPLLTLLILNNLFAQKQTGSELSVGIEGGLPLGDFKDSYKFGFGGTAKYAYNLDETIALTLQSGYISFPGKSFDYIIPYINYTGTPPTAKIKLPSLRQIPMKAGVRFLLGNVYFEPQLGVSFISTSEKKDTYLDIYKTNNTAFSYAGNIGIFATKEIDISARYEGFKMNDRNVAMIGFRVAYNFSL